MGERGEGGVLGGREIAVTKTDIWPCSGHCGVMALRQHVCPLLVGVSVIIYNIDTSEVL